MFCIQSMISSKTLQGKSLSWNSAPLLLLMLPLWVSLLWRMTPCNVASTLVIFIPLVHVFSPQQGLLQCLAPFLSLSPCTFHWLLWVERNCHHEPTFSVDPCFDFNYLLTFPLWITPILLLISSTARRENIASTMRAHITSLVPTHYAYGPNPCSYNQWHCHHHPLITVIFPWTISKFPARIFSSLILFLKGRSQWLCH